LPLAATAGTGRGDAPRREPARGQPAAVGPLGGRVDGRRARLSRAAGCADRRAAGTAAPRALGGGGRDGLRRVGPGRAPGAAPAGAARLAPLVERGLRLHPPFRLPMLVPGPRWAA